MQKMSTSKKVVRKAIRKKEVRFVGVTFNDEKIHQGEIQLNYLLSKDFFIMKSYQTPTGVVYELGRPTR